MKVHIMDDASRDIDNLLVFFKLIDDHLKDEACLV